MSESMKFALACRMFSGWGGKIENNYEDVLGSMREEGDKTIELVREVEKLIEDNFIDTTSWHFRHISKSLRKDLDGIKWCWPVYILTENYHYDYYHPITPYFTIENKFVGDVVIAEMCLKFADEMISEGKEGIVLTLPVNQDFVKILANYNTNKNRADNYLENEFPIHKKQQEGWREELLKMKAIVEQTLNERDGLVKKPVVLEKAPVLEQKINDTIATKLSVCDRISNWWNNI